MKPFSLSENLRRARWYARHDQPAVSLGIVIDILEQLAAQPAAEVRRWVSQATGWLGQAADLLCESEPNLSGRLRACAEAGREILRETRNGTPEKVFVAPVEGDGRGPEAPADCGTAASGGPDGGG